VLSGDHGSSEQRYGSGEHEPLCVPQRKSQNEASFGKDPQHDYLRTEMLKGCSLKEERAMRWRMGRHMGKALRELALM